MIKINITGAIFDMDGTLVDSLMIWDELWRRLGKKYLNDEQFRPDPETERAVRTLPLLEAMTLVHENCRVGDSGEEIWRFTTDMMIDFYKNEVRMKAGALEFLDRLQREGVKMCIASATAPDLIDIAMDTCGLKKYFSRVVSCRDVGKGKEHPDVFIAAHEYLGTLKESTWVFEDSVVAIETAVKAGYNTVGIYDRYNYGTERIPLIATVFVGEGDSLLSLVENDDR